MKWDYGQRERLLAIGALGLGLGLAALVLCQPRPARALSCIAPPAQHVVFPAKDGAALPAKGVIALYYVSAGPPKVGLFDIASKRRIAVKRAVHKAFGLLLLRPKTTLRSGRRFELRLGRRVLRRFVAAKKGARSSASPRGKAMLGKATVRFGPVRVLGWYGTPYLPGVVSLASGHAAAVGFEVRYRSKQGRSYTQRFTLPFSRQLLFSSAEMCPYWQTGLAPLRGGRYQLRLVPISEAGQLGKPTVLSGKVPQLKLPAKTGKRRH
jgi:hypothetical protein